MATENRQTPLDRLNARKATRQSELDTAIAAFNARNNAIERAHQEQVTAAADINVLSGKVQELADQIAEEEEVKWIEDRPSESLSQSPPATPVVP